jgi:hypothetical protein
MSNDAITHLILASVGVFSIALWAAYVLVPAWTAYGRWWERLVATFLSLYVLAAMALVGIGLGAAFLYYYDRL